MHEIELVLGLLVVVAALVTLARRVRISYPIVLVIGGLILSFLPGLPRVELDPDLVFLLFLPPLLYYAAVFTSVRDIRDNLRPIGLLAVGLVLFTTAAVAVVAHAAIPGMSWALAFALGAIVSPPDAVAATTIVQRLGVPRRIVTLLEGESLINDATALVVYRVAVVAAVTGAFSILETGISFVVVAVGGVLIGLVAGWLSAELRRRLDDPPVEITIALLTPFAAYLPAEELHVSGVLAAVTCGLFLNSRLPHISNSTMRVLGRGVWEMLIFLLNGLVFILIGLQLRSVMAGLSLPLATVLGYAVLIGATVIVARFVWVFPASYLPSYLSPSLRARDPYPSWRHVTIVAWTGMRGVVSLAAALALPFTTATGEPFPQRHLILFLTFSVILATLVLQGLSLAPLVRWLGVGEDGSARHDEAHARAAATEAALERLDGLHDEWPTHAELIDNLRAQYEHRGRHSSASHHERDEDDIDDGHEDLELIEHRQIRQSVIQAERDAVQDLSNRGVISDEVRRRLERELDFDELREEA